MKKEIRELGDGVMRVTTVDERWYVRDGIDPATGLPVKQFVPSVTWIAGHYPKGIGFYKWLANTGWDESQALRNAAGDKGSRVHHAIMDLIDGHTVAMDAKVAGSDGVEAELSLEEYECLMSFRDFWKACEPETLAREMTVFSAEHNYAGTLDWVGMFNKPPKGLSKGPWLLDWKTSQQVWPEHEMQVSAYSHSDWMGHLAADGSLRLADYSGRCSLGILQLGYRLNKAKWKLTEVEDQFPLFLAAKQIWAHETEGEKPKQRDYPLTLSLGIADAVGTTPATDTTGAAYVTEA